MSRTATVATIVASILASPAFAASDQKIGNSRDLMSAAFRCSVYAYRFHDPKEQQRLVRIGLKAGRDYVEWLKTLNEPPERIIEMTAYWGEVSTDFVVGAMYDKESTDVYNEIVPGPREAEAKAHIAYRTGNCSLIK